MEFYPQIVNKYKGIKGFVSWYNYSARMRYKVTDKAKFKAKVVTFFEKHGLKAPKIRRKSPVDSRIIDRSFKV